MTFKYSNQDLDKLKSLPLDDKIQLSASRIVEWYQHWNGMVYVSYSGGKDSTVLLHLVRKIYPEVKACFSNTGLEYPELQQTVRNQPNVDIVYPTMNFVNVITEHGYPLVSKEMSEAIYYARRVKAKDGSDFKIIEKSRSKFLGGGSEATRGEKKWMPICQLPIRISNKCCDIMKKKPQSIYQHDTKSYPYIGVLTEESKLRERAWLQHGCNNYDTEKPVSQPLSFWTEQDILEYISRNNLQIPSVYGDIVYDGETYKTTGVSRTGCIFCLFGMQFDKGESRFQLLAKTHPKQYEYCLGGGEWIDNPNYDEAIPKYDGLWLNWNPKKIIVPSKEGLGYKQIFDMVNEIYGENFYRY